VEQPNRLAVGLTHVLANDTPTLLHGVATGKRGGEVIRAQG